MCLPFLFASPLTNPCSSKFSVPPPVSYLLPTLCLSCFCRSHTHTALLGFCLCSFFFWGGVLTLPNPLPFSCIVVLTQFTDSWIGASKDVVFGSSTLLSSPLSLLSSLLPHFRLSIFWGQSVSTGRGLDGRHWGCKLKSAPHPQGPGRWHWFVNGPDGTLAGACPKKGSSCYSAPLIGARWELGPGAARALVFKKPEMSLLSATSRCPNTIQFCS